MTQTVLIRDCDTQELGFHIFSVVRHRNQLLTDDMKIRRGR